MKSWLLYGLLPKAFKWRQTIKKSRRTSNKKLSFPCFHTRKYVRLRVATPCALCPSDSVESLRLCNAPEPVRYRYVAPRPVPRSGGSVCLGAPWNFRRWVRIYTCVTPPAVPVRSNAAVPSLSRTVHRAPYNPMSWPGTMVT